jgi:signal transduction histidine kinase
LQRPLLHAVRKTCAGEPLSTFTELMGAAAELIDDLARNMIDLYQQNREGAIQQQRSELLALYEKAQQAVRSRDEVLAIVCHDLRNQLMQVVTARSLYDRTPEIDMKEHLNGMMKRQTQSMVRLLGDLLDSTAMDHGQLTINKDWTDPEALLNETLELQIPVAERKSIRVLKEIAVGIPGVHCDAMRIGQVLSNLLSNAIKFTPNDGTITLRLDCKDNHVRFSVSDNGPGISEEDLPHVFERYWRGKTDHGGVGLGLTIVNAIVKAHGGTAWAESEFGKGSTFSFSLPESTAQTCAA